MNGKKWSEFDIKFLKNNHNAIPIREIAEKLNRTTKSVSMQVNRLGIASKKPTLSEKEDRFIRENYGKMTSKMIAEELGYPQSKIRNYIKTRKIKSSGYYWSDDEVKLLEDKIGSVSVKTISKTLNRSVYSIRGKYQNTGIGGYISNTEDMTLTAVSDVLGLHRTTVARFTKSGELKSKKRGHYRMIREKDLLKFMQQNPQKWEARKCDYYTFQRFDWFQEKRKIELDNETKKRWGKWLKD